MITIGAGVLGLIVLVGAAYSIYRWNNTTYAGRGLKRVTSAGYRERRQALSNGTGLNFAAGPDNGPAVLLLHAQSAAWQSYARVLPELAEDSHVYAVDIAGHGGSDRTPGRYDVHNIGRDIVLFIEEVVGAPVLLSGHSSGGLVAAWVAAKRPDLVWGVLFEDPPFFSTEPDRMPHQFNYVDLALAPPKALVGGQAVESGGVTMLDYPRPPPVPSLRSTVTQR